jgi:pyruvate kinase
VGSNKAADIERDIELPSITEKDRKAIEIGRKAGIKHFALSFSSSRREVEKFRDLTGEGAYIISKVESKKGVANIDGILEASDAILIDRGDLSRQVPIELVPFFQRRLISTAKLAEKEVFVATNLLESMIISQQPTRAEVNDIVSTIEMGATGLVLAAETAVGKYPIGSVKMVRKLTKQFNRWTSNTSLRELLQAGVNGSGSSV